MASTVNTASMLVATSTGPIAGSWSVSTDGRIATFVPATPFGGFSQVNVQVTTAVQDRVGRPLAEAAVSGYLTADSVPPSFASISPAGGATGVAPGATVRVAYGEAINPAAFVTPAIEMRLAGAPVAGQIAAILNNTVLVFTPASPLQANATYSVVVQPAVDVFGNVQPQGAAFLFSTIDTLAPAIQQLVADRTTAVEGSVVSVVADLGSAADVASVEFMVNGTVVRTDMQAPYDASIPVTTSLSPSFSVSARAADLAGNISSPVSVTIAVQTDSPPTVADLEPRRRRGGEQWKFGESPGARNRRSRRQPARVSDVRTAHARRRLRREPCGADLGSDVQHCSSGCDGARSSDAPCGGERRVRRIEPNGLHYAHRGRRIRPHRADS